MQTILDIIQNLAKQRGRGETGPLIMLRQLDPLAGERISHLPVEGELGQAWLALTGEPFRPHQAQVLTALRRGEPVALGGDSPAVNTTAFLMVYGALHAEAQATALILAADAAAAREMAAQLAAINAELVPGLRLATTLVEPGQRPDLVAPLVIATPETLHHRLLRHHDRAWFQFWARLRLTLLLDMQAHHGVAGSHLADLLLRLQRVALAHSGHTSGLLATMLDMAEPQPALKTLLGGVPWRVISGNDVAMESTSLAVWEATNNRLREAAELAIACNKQGYQVHIACRRLEAAALAPMVGDISGISFGPASPPAHVLVAAGFPGSHAALWRLLRAGYQAVVLVLGDLPHERLLARHTESLLGDSSTHWPPAPPNAYTTAQHVLCAASELPLTAAEVAQWGAQEIVDRLVEHGKLVDLPDAEVAWKPTPEVGDPYQDVSMRAASGAALLARNEKGQLLDLLDPTTFERWAFPNAALPPGAGGLRVTARDEDGGSLTLRLESNGRRSYPLRRATVNIRDERESRALHTTQRIGWGRVMIEEQIYAYREATVSTTPTEIALRPELESRWATVACWIDLAEGVQVLGQFIGWSLAAALATRTLAAFTDVVPCYDHERKRLFLVDAQPGGNGLAAWVYQHAEDLLPLAYDIAHACRNDALLEPMARVDMDWLLALLGKRVEEQRAAAEQRAVAERQRIAARPAPLPEILEPPPATTSPTLVVGTPADEPRKPTEKDRNRRPEPRPPVRTPPPAQGSLPFDQPARNPPPARNQPPPPAARPNNPPPPPPTRTTPPAAETPADANALIERLRRQRQQREADLARGVVPPRPQRPANAGRPPANIEPRFKPGEQVFCLPYGDGTVHESWFEGDREMLIVSFPDHGELTIDPSVSLVRKLQDPTSQVDDLL